MILINNPQGESRTSEKGNVLFLILIAVALFAALSYAVTQSTRSGGGDASKETNLVNAAGITQYPSSVKTAITRMIVSNSTDPNDLLFDKPATFASLSTALLQSQGVFHPSGGGATYNDAPASVMQTNAAGPWVFNGRNQILNIGTSAAGAATALNADIIAFLPNVKRAVCDSIHGRLGLSLTYVTLTGIDIATQMDFATPNIIGLGGNITGANLDGQPQGCFMQPANTYHYFHVVVER